MKITYGVILAGGRSSRMDGKDKSFARIGDENLLTRTVRQLTPQVQQLFINTNSDVNLFSAYKLPILADRLPGLLGPLAGIHAALTEHPNDLVLTVAVDIPHLPADLASRLQDSLGDAACAYTFNGEHHALAILWAPGSDGLVEAYLATGERSLKGFLAQHGRAVLFDRPGDAGLFDNINTPEDLARVEQALSRTELRT